MRDHYQLIIVANFQDDANHTALFEAMGTEKPVITLEVPDIKPLGLGQPSLADMQGLFDAQDKDHFVVVNPWAKLPVAKTGGTLPMKTVELTVERSRE